MKGRTPPPKRVPTDDTTFERTRRAYFDRVRQVLTRDEYAAYIAVERDTARTPALLAIDDKIRRDPAANALGDSLQQMLDTRKGT